MATIRPRDLLTDSLLGDLGGAGAADVAALAEAGYLNVALPPEFGGLGCTLRQAACGQRRLARHAPRTALAVSAHLYWTGAAADAYRAGDDSVRWILAEAARGALFAGGHGQPGDDLRFADHRSRCEPDGAGNYRFADAGILATGTPGWDWIAVHAVHHTSRCDGPQSVIAFAGRDARCTPAFRVARVQRSGAPGEVFTASALTWGHSILASVEYSDARRAYNAALTAYAEAATTAMLITPATAVDSAAASRPAGRWPVAESGARLDAMKARIAEITHSWQLVQEPAPDLGGQHVINLHAMRHEVADGAASVHELAQALRPTPQSMSVPPGSESLGRVSGCQC
jgi:alkylation response protein AidB-like acyl-CoA dehydrogenase